MEIRGNRQYHYGKPDYTHWAPEVIQNNGICHMYLSVVPGIFNDWNAPREIVHLTSQNLTDWQYESKLDLHSDCVIDPCVIPLHDGNWRMWFKNERATDGSIYFADSARQSTDGHAGVVAYKSTDLKSWNGPHLVFSVQTVLGQIQPTAWAPEMHRYRGKLYLFITLHNNDKLLDEPVPITHPIYQGKPATHHLRGTQIFIADFPDGPFGDSECAGINRHVCWE